MQVFFITFFLKRLTLFLFYAIINAIIFKCVYIIYIKKETGYAVW